MSSWTAAAVTQDDVTVVVLMETKTRYRKRYRKRRRKRRSKLNAVQREIELEAMTCAFARMSLGN